MRSVRKTFAVSTAVVLGLLACSIAEASHFRGGTMSVRVSPDGVLTVTSETLWRKPVPTDPSGNPVFPLSGITRLGFITATNPAGPFPGGFPIDLQILDPTTRAVLASALNGTLPAPDIVSTTTSVDMSDPFFDIRKQQFTIDLAGLGLGFGSYILYWSDGGRIEGLQNVTSDVFLLNSSQGPFSLEAKFIYDGTQRDTPTISSRVLTTVVQGQLYSNNLNASGNGPLTYQLLLGSGSPRYGPTTQIPGLAVDSTGQVSIPAADTDTLEFENPAGEPGGDYVFKVVISDVDGQYIEQDVMLDVEEAPNQVCSITISDTAPTVQVGETLVLTATATDPDAGDSLSISTTPAVENATLTQTGTNPATATWTFTPDLSDVGILGVNFTADDNGDPSLSCVVNAQITVEAPDPMVPIEATGEVVPGVASNSKTGSALAGCGDIFTVLGGAMNLGDIFAGAPGFEDPDNGVPVEAGAAALYFGSTDDAELASQDVIFTGEVAHDRAGVAVACGFFMDLNMVSTPVLVIGAEQVNRTGMNDPDAGCDDGAACGAGKVYVILFDPYHPNNHYPNITDPTTPDVVSLSLVGQPGGIPGWVLEGENLADQAGFCTAGGCDLDGSGGPEIIVGAPGANNTTSMINNTGVVYVLFDLDLGATGPFDGTPISLGDVAGGVPGTRYEGDEDGGQLGYACACVGDVVGGPDEDLGFTAPFQDVNPKDAGVAYVVSGGDHTSGIIETCDIGTGTTSGTQVQGEQEEENLGTSISAGSLMLGAPFFDPDSARVNAGRVIRATSKLPFGILSASSIGDPDPSNPDAQPGAIYHGESAGDGLGVAVAGLFDVTNDGIPDFAMGAPFADINPEDAGKTYVVEGTSDTDTAQGIIETCDIGQTEPGRQLDGSQTGEQSGSTITNTGDINGNPSNDFAIGAPFRDVFASADDAGTLYLILESDNLGVDNVIPVANAGLDQTPACMSGMATALLDGSASSDGDSTPGTNDDIVSFEWSEGGVPLDSGEQVSVPFAPGIHEVLLTVMDSEGEMSQDTVIVLSCPLELALEKVEIDWPSQNEPQVELKIHGRVDLPSGTQPEEVYPQAGLALDVAGQAEILAESFGLDVFGSNNNKWDYKNLPPGTGVSQFAIHWDGANFDYQDVVRIKSEFIGLTETALSISQENSNHAIVMELNGVTTTIDETGAVSVIPDTVPYEVDEDGEVTLTLPFELVPEMEINLTIGAWAPASIPVADHYSTANGKFMLNAKVDPAGLTGDSRPATVEFRMKLGNGQGYPGSVSVAEDQWKKLSGNEWKGDLSD